MGDSAQEIIIALEDGQIQLYDSASKSLIRQVSTGASGLTGLAVADLDRDGLNELIFASSNQLLVYSMHDGVIWRQPNSGGDTEPRAVGPPLPRSNSESTPLM